MAQTAKKQSGRPAQTMVVQSGNEIAATAAKQINYHVMGYYPITPSTEVAETLDAMKAEGEHTIRMIPGDGEHGAAGICFGASTAGGRVFNATSANGLLFAFEQLPVQSGERFPMVFNIVTRAVSGPLDIRGDHSDIMLAMNTGWITLMAADAQSVYDMNVMAPKIGEEMSVRLPVFVAFDGFFTSHQKRRVEIFADQRSKEFSPGRSLVLGVEGERLWFRLVTCGACRRIMGWAFVGNLARMSDAQLAMTQTRLGLSPKPAMRTREAWRAAYPADGGAGFSNAKPYSAPPGIPGECMNMPPHLPVPARCRDL